METRAGLYGRYQGLRFLLYSLPCHSRAWGVAVRPASRPPCPPRAHPRPYGRLPTQPVGTGRKLINFSIFTFPGPWARASGSRAMSLPCPVRSRRAMSATRVRGALIAIRASRWRPAGNVRRVQPLTSRPYVSKTSTVGWISIS
jgi:hypothetical protein